MRRNNTTAGLWAMLTVASLTMLSSADNRPLSPPFLATKGGELKDLNLIQPLKASRCCLGGSRVQPGTVLWTR